MKMTESQIPDHRRYWESLDFTITKTVIEEGDTSSWKPRIGASGSISFSLLNLTGIVEDQLCNDVLLSKYFSSSPCEFLIGSAETEVDRQLEKCIQSCYPGQIAQFNMRVLLEPEYNGAGRGGLDVVEPDWISLEFKLNLETLLNAQPVYKWFNETKLTKAREMHSSGVRLFKEKRYLDSFHMFTQAYKLAVLARGIPEDNYAQSKEAEDLQNLCYNNLGACHFQWKNFSNVVELSGLVLQSQPSNVKTLYRRGVSYLSMQEFDLAEKDLVHARQLEPNNRAVHEKLGLVQQRKKSAELKLGSRISKMFSS
ncbi:peptidyl-prolyl cis-trans isomerase FKBP62 [Eurytemora carolleeae]|uniref:peptidyl-prolyl cis-trans isomerase FKBP62 n=1 Tax=Eurytemora carolleeae TaxID=1294199 RepID=UPI000C76534C|nr:peptidyl-prolyl cis-trans isomerase FKBP62 [Eurytemora carolleeae]|eukprot:XP_023329569.1 peptidyl-prolyl cis-trans isomerase FKBP62-like [Eurytemora affinis]